MLTKDGRPIITLNTFTYLSVFSQREAIILSTTDCTISLSASLLLQDHTFPLLPMKVSSCGNTLDRETKERTCVVSILSLGIKLDLYLHCGR